jgi:3-phenylpropionate/trans-cinnamate dioxygenase ferredoxin subunit
VGGDEILICNADGEFFAIADVCSHDGGALDQGELEDCRIACPRHGALFDIRTGEALTLPAILPIATYPVEVAGDEIFLSR